MLEKHLEKLRGKRQFKEDLEAILETEAGKRFFRRFLRDCNVTRPRFSSEPLQTAFFEGPRHLAMSYLNLLGRDDPEAIIKIIEQETEDAGRTRS